MSSAWGVECRRRDRSYAALHRQPPTAVDFIHRHDPVKILRAETYARTPHIISKSYYNLANPQSRVTGISISVRSKELGKYCTIKRFHQ